MLRGNLAIKKIKKDTDNFSLEGMIEPTFITMEPKMFSFFM